MGLLLFQMSRAMSQAPGTARRTATAPTMNQRLRMMRMEGKAGVGLGVWAQTPHLTPVISVYQTPLPGKPLVRVTLR